MRKFKKSLIFAAVAAVVALGATAVYAGPWFGGKKAERAKTFVQWKVDDALDQLDANAAQRAEIKGLADRLVDSALTRFDDREALREELLALWQAPTADTEKARAVVFARIESVRALVHEGIDAAAQTHAALQPKQRQMVTAFVEERAKDREMDPAERAERAERFTGYVVDEVVDRADATDAQAKQLRGLADGLVKSGLARMGDREGLRAELLGLWNASKADPAKAKAIADARIDAWKAMAGEAIDTAAQAHGILEAGQRDQIADAIRKRANRWR